MDTSIPATNRRNMLAITVSYLIVGAVAISNLVAYPATRRAMVPLLIAFVALMLVENWIVQLPRWASSAYLLVQVALMAWLFFIEPLADRWSLLLIPSCIFVMRHYEQKRRWLWIGFFIAAMGVMISYGHGIYAPELIVIYVAAYLLVASYALMLKQTQITQRQSQAVLQQLQEANQQLRDYAGRVEELTSINERNRLARELHDSVTQTIFSMTLITRSALILQERDPTQVPEKLKQLQDLAQNALSEMRALISQLRPLSVSEDGLAAVLSKHIGEVGRRSNVKLSLEVASDSLPLGANQQQEVFRIIQEALNNVVKHSQADQASVRVSVVDDGVRIAIRDNGVGFDPRSSRDSRLHIGMDSMRERAREMGGELEINSTTGQGTEVTVTVPKADGGDSHG